MDIWLLLCMGFVFLALAEYATILGMRFSLRTDPNEKIELALKKKCGKIDKWVFKIFIGMYILVVSTYFYCVYSYV